jgi:hypothetical protein
MKTYFASLTLALLPLAAGQQPVIAPPRSPAPIQLTAEHRPQLQLKVDQNQVAFEIEHMNL